MVEVMSFTLQGIGYAVLNLTFFASVWLLYVMNRKLNVLDFYRTVAKKPYLYLLSDIILQSIIAGVIISLVLVFIGVPLFYNDMLLLLVPVSILLSTFRLRFLCITYGAFLIGSFSLIFNGQQMLGIHLPDVEVHVPSLIILVGILHLIEGVFVYLFGHQRAVPVISKKNDRIVMGHIIQKTWVIPLAVIVLQIGIASAGGVAMPDWWPAIKYTGYGESIFYTLLPLIAFSSYTSIFYGETPKERTRFSGLSLMAFGGVTLIVAKYAMDSILLQLLGIILMLMIHEFVYMLEKQREKSKSPVYVQPQLGIRIMDVLEGGYGEQIGLEKGDIIEEIDGLTIENINEYMRIAKEKKTEAIISIRRLNGVLKEFQIHDRNHLEHLGIRVVPEKPMFLYPYDKLSYVGMFEFLKR